jgi:hypothetical protein
MVKYKTWLTLVTIVPDPSNTARPIPTAEGLLVEDGKKELRIPGKCLNPICMPGWA